MAFTISEHWVRWKAYWWCNGEDRNASCASWALFKGCGYCSLSGTLFLFSCFLTVFSTFVWTGPFALLNWSSLDRWAQPFLCWVCKEWFVLFIVFITVVNNIGWTNIPAAVCQFGPECLNFKQPIIFPKFLNVMFSSILKILLVWWIIIWHPFACSIYCARYIFKSNWRFRSTKLRESMVSIYALGVLLLVAKLFDIHCVW